MNFLTGLGIGLGLAVLFAPKRGEELRSELGEKATEVTDRAKQSIDDIKHRVRRGVESMKSSSKPATGTEG